ncbi:MAG: hypothetical protein AAGJ35_01820, partial [Myxococcota bacterium]
MDFVRRTNHQAKHTLNRQAEQSGFNSNGGYFNPSEKQQKAKVTEHLKFGNFENYMEHCAVKEQPVMVDVQRQAEKSDFEGCSAYCKDTEKRSAAAQKIE